MSKRLALIIFGVIAIAAAVVTVVLVSSKSDEDSSSSSSPSSGEGGDETENNNNIDEIISGTNKTNITEPTSDPKTAKFAFTAMAIGDWGATKDKPGSCCNRYRIVEETSLEYKQDYHAQKNIAELMAQSATTLSSVGEVKAVLGHGDNVYWNGVGAKDSKNRMTTTFEDVYYHDSIKQIPWINVAGNHDIGGSDYLCGDEDYKFVKCTSKEAMLSALNAKFDLQKAYVSPNNNRWIMEDHYYKKTFKEGDVSVDIFNIDTNYADSHAAHQVCCQCYGYSNGEADGNDCNAVQKGDKYCVGGNMEWYESCMAVIKGWWDDSMKKVKVDLKASTATYKIVNTHYSPHFHMGEPKMKAWYSICAEYGVHIWFNGHTHGFNHDISTWGTHFFENGGGGGIQSETSGFRPDAAKEYVSTEWIGAGAPYGYFELSFSKDWLKVQFATFNSDWTFSTDLTKVVKGTVKRDHCWYVPQTTGKGREC